MILPIRIFELIKKRLTELTIDKIIIHVKINNNSEANTKIILLHGFGGDKDNWNRFSTKLNNKKIPYFNKV